MLLKFILILVLIGILAGLVLQQRVLQRCRVSDPQTDSDFRLFGRFCPYRPIYAAALRLNGVGSDTGAGQPDYACDLHIDSGISPALVQRKNCLGTRLAALQRPFKRGRGSHWLAAGPYPCRP